MRNGFLSLMALLVTQNVLAFGSIETAHECSSVSRKEIVRIGENVSQADGYLVSGFEVLFNAKATDVSVTPDPQQGYQPSQQFTLVVNGNSGQFRFNSPRESINDESDAILTFNGRVISMTCKSIDFPFGH